MSTKTDNKISNKENKNMNKTQLLEMEPLDDNEIAEMYDAINEAFAIGDDQKARELIADIELNKEIIAALSV